ncbi:hypothetical protein L798_01225 [Zootermopsis nevadensis]|uniref:Uncharacterized protein n=1 Tax=Zootermopsis nevadensis TaxID=136037 RepID=A0A067QSQ8_ZOONE|nr:hypothetical protein L798_01225 [Zootermopsis nevadensis]
MVIKYVKVHPLCVWPSLVIASLGVQEHVQMARIHGPGSCP